MDGCHFSLCKSEQIFTCPSAEVVNASNADRRVRKYTYNKNLPNRCATDGGSDYPGECQSFGSYGVSQAYWSAGFEGPVNADGPATDKGRGRALSAFQSPATTIWVTDSGNAGGGGENYRVVGFANTSDLNVNAGPPRMATGSYSGGLVERHLDTSVVLYADGHVKSSKLDQLMARKARASDGEVIMPAFTVQDD